MLINDYETSLKQWTQFVNQTNGAICTLEIGFNSTSNIIIYVKKDSVTSLSVQLCLCNNKLPLTTIAKTEQSKVYSVAVTDITKQTFAISLAQILARVFEILRSKDPVT